MLLFHFYYQCMLINVYLHYSEIPACEAMPCLNGGSCTNTKTGFTCYCAEGWRGNTCEESKCIVALPKLC